MRTMVRAAAVGSILSAVLMLPSAGLADGLGRTIYVSHAAARRAADANCRTASYQTVQAAVTAARPGQTVYLCGTAPYSGPVIIQKDLAVAGDRGATIKAIGTGAADQIPVSDLPGDDPDLVPPQAVVAVLSSVSVSVDGLTIEGPFANTTCPAEDHDDFGILAFGQSGAGANLQLDGDTITHVVSSSLPDCPLLGVGVLLGRHYFPNTSGGRDVVDFVAHGEVRDTTIDDYESQAVLADGPSTTIHVERSVVQDPSESTNPNLAPWGIGISRGATGEVDHNLIKYNESAAAQPGAIGIGFYTFGGCTDISTGGPLDVGVKVHDNVFVNNDAGIEMFEGDDTSQCLDPTDTPVHEEVVHNQVIKNDGVTDRSPYTDVYGTGYPGYQTGIVDESNSDTIADNWIWSDDGAFGPQVTASGAWLTPIDIQSYPDTNPLIYGNHYNGQLTTPPYPGQAGAPSPASAG